MPTKRPSTYERLSQSSWMRRILEFRLVRFALKPARGDTSFNRFVRYSLVSGVAIVISQATILICTWIFGLSGIAANTIGALAATPASYELNRKWAWGKHGKSHLWREVVPFWSLSLLGFLASTGTVQLADNFTKAQHIVGLPRSLVLMGASLFAYGIVWVLKFVVFNRLFISADSGGDSDEDEGSPLVDGSVVGPAGLAPPAHHHPSTPQTPQMAQTPPTPQTAWDEPSVAR